MCAGYDNPREQRAMRETVPVAPAPLAIYRLILRCEFHLGQTKTSDSFLSASGNFINGSDKVRDWPDQFLASFLSVFSHKHSFEQLSGWNRETVECEELFLSLDTILPSTQCMNSTNLDSTTSSLALLWCPNGAKHGFKSTSTSRALILEFIWYCRRYCANPSQLRITFKTFE